MNIITGLLKEVTRKVTQNDTPHRGCRAEGYAIGSGVVDKRRLFVYAGRMKDKARVIATVRVAPEVRERLTALAAADQRRLSDLLREAVGEYTARRTEGRPAREVVQA